MTDTVTAEVRSRMMAAIRSRDTSLEMAVRKMLHGMGFRYRIHKKVGKARPDMLLPKYSAAVFIHGCFWHGHLACRNSRIPKSNVEFWSSKIEGNAARDRRNEEEMLELGWRIAVVWECAVRPAARDATLKTLAGWLRNGEQRLEIAGDPIDHDVAEGEPKRRRSQVD
ncbi:very short patch repair endonuclease [Pararhizobium sp. BT-229]|uniref:very short patch repair endonuclease n=1 Tax=Pararhizobium sp. BT-229 TaxID=2986923 RepID=UPI0021F76A14|nr:very short patch repair endonuclease [Pararhizobium sp. BT-229]MCV9964719.1 very short patch repair endonuclease [Pararhizobium sp. BT-229]